MGEKNADKSQGSEKDRDQRDTEDRDGNREGLGQDPAKDHREQDQIQGGCNNQEATSKVDMKTDPVPSTATVEPATPTLPLGWTSAVDASGKKYYCNTATRQTQWE